MEPASPIQALGVNPFPSRFINRTVPFCALIEERANENREMTAGSRRITKENGSIYNSTRERVDSRN